MPNTPLRQLLAQTQFIRFWWARLTGSPETRCSWWLSPGTGMTLPTVPGIWDWSACFNSYRPLLLTVPAGHVADRYHRGRIFALCMLVQALIAVLLVAASTTGLATRELILGLSVALGSARAFQMPAQQALTPLLVPQKLLQRAIALSSRGMQAAIICGPAMGGVFYVSGPALAYVSCAALLLVAGALAMALRYPHKPSMQAATWPIVLAGLEFVWRRKVLLRATSLNLFAVLLGGATALLPIYARDILHSGPIGLGFLRSAPAVGALVMSVVLMRWPLHRHVGHRLVAAVAVFGAATPVFGLSTSFSVSILALAIAGAADTISVVTRLTLMQLETPDELRGRVSAVNSIFIGASNQLGKFESGATSTLLGPLGSAVLGGVGTVLIAASWLRLFPALGKRDHMS
jgi:MFS family permease